MSDTERSSSSPSASTPDSGADYLPAQGQPDAETSPSPELQPQRSASPKGNTGTSEAGSTAAGTNAQKQTKRRAARACVSCRARKVRCDVVENSPCGNCKWDGVKCEVQESRRRRKNFPHGMVGSGAGADPMRKNMGLPVGMPSQQLRMATPGYGRQGSMSDVAGGVGLAGALETGHHLFLQQRGMPQYVTDANTRLMAGSVPWNGPAFGPNADFSPEAFPPSVDQSPRIQFPPYIKPLPSKLSPVDVNYLYQKGALLIPTPKLQKALLKAYVEFVHPYMPLLELSDILRILDGREPGSGAKIGLLLYQAVMFVSVAFVDVQHLRDEDYPSRKAARKAFFSRVRALYDFDVEGERHVLVQALLLMTYWYETPDDQKDTWHWMGVAISLAHTIGLHRNPTNLTTITLRKQRLFKRIWWSCFMRDRLIALGMRRPTRIQDEDFDVPMLEEADFEIEVLPEDNQFLGPDCKLIRDASMQRQLALMCIEKAKLCVLISRVLKVQYSVLSREGIPPDNTTDSTMMLYPNKTLDNFERIERLDDELAEWLRNLPECCRFRPVTQAEITNGDSTIALHRTLLHMVYRATIAALHRPQFLPAPPMPVPPMPGDVPPTKIQEIARTKVHESARHVMTMAAQLHQAKLDRYLPTTGVTAILPAMIIHLFEMKSPDVFVCRGATERFQQGMKVLGKLQESYAAADFAAKFLEAAYHKLQLGTGVMFHRHKSNPGGEPKVLEMMGTLTDPTGVERSAPQLPLPNHEVFMGPADLDMPYPEHPGLPRTFDVMTPRPGSLTPPRTDSSSSESEQFGTITPASSSIPQRPPEATATMCQQDGIWESYSMSSQQQLNMDTDLEVSQWLQFPAEGVSNSDEVMIDVFSNTEGAGDVGTHSIDWMKIPQQHVQQPLQQFQHSIRASDISELEMLGLGSAGRAA